METGVRSMKSLSKITVLTTALLAAQVNAHGHSPVTYGGKANIMDAISTSSASVVPIAVKNTSSKPTDFNISVNGKVVMTTGKLSDTRYHKFNVPVTIDDPNKPTTFFVCSTNIPEGVGSKIALSICTEAQLMWVK